MTEASLHQLEREVEAARAKLAADLAKLRSPETSAEFTAGLKERAQSTIDNIIEDAKRRAAANPVAALAIGAGIGWRLLRHPPIATTLIGAGLVSLFRTPPARINGRHPADYLSHARARLVQQASDVAEAAKHKAAETTESLREKAVDLAGAAKEQAQDAAAQASATARRATTQVSHQLGAVVNDASGKMQDLRDRSSSAARTAMWRADAQADDWSRSAQRAVNDPDIRDTVLLGAAGLAVAAAVGIAWQRRSPEHAR